MPYILLEHMFEHKGVWLVGATGGWWRRVGLRDPRSPSLPDGRRRSVEGGRRPWPAPAFPHSVYRRSVTYGPVKPPPGLCVLIAGLPGTGKRTIASALTRRLATTREVRLVDNHYIANPVLGVVEQDGRSPLRAEVWERVADVRAAVLQAIERLAPTDWIFEDDAHEVSL
jgi:hypothetical protein